MPTSGMPVCASSGETSAFTKGSPRNPSARDEKVIPSWFAERYPSRFFTTWTARETSVPVSLPWLSSWLGRTFTIANSDATKNAFSSRKKQMPKR